jgi:hypothetical protein
MAMDIRIILIAIWNYIFLQIESYSVMQPIERTVKDNWEH